MKYIFLLVLTVFIANTPEAAMACSPAKRVGQAPKVELGPSTGPEMVENVNPNVDPYEAAKERVRELIGEQNNARNQVKNNRSEDSWEARWRRGDSRNTELWLTNLAQIEGELYGIYKQYPELQPPRVEDPRVVARRNKLIQEFNSPVQSGLQVSGQGEQVERAN